MKTMRYRIRFITLVLVIAVAAVLLWTVRMIWFPSVPLPLSSEVSTPVPSEFAPSEVSPSPDETSMVETLSPEPLYDTTGL